MPAPDLTDMPTPHRHDYQVAAYGWCPECQPASGAPMLLTAEEVAACACGFLCENPVCTCGCHLGQVFHFDVVAWAGPSEPVGER